MLKQRIDFTLTCLRGSVPDLTELAQSLQERWKLDQLPNISVVAAEAGRETGLHIPRVDVILSADFAAVLDSPWGIDAVAESICVPLKQLLRVQTVVFEYKVSADAG